MVTMSLEAGVGVLGNKVGMLTYFTDDGLAVPCTVIGFHEGNIVTQVKSAETRRVLLRPGRVPARPRREALEARGRAHEEGRRSPAPSPPGMAGVPRRGAIFRRRAAAQPRGAVQGRRHHRHLWDQHREGVRRSVPLPLPLLDSLSHHLLTACELLAAEDLGQLGTCEFLPMLVSKTSLGPALGRGLSRSIPLPLLDSLSHLLTDFERLAPEDKLSLSGRLYSSACSVVQG